MMRYQADLKKWAVIIVGSGPVGLRVAERLLKGNPDCPILIYGKEPDAPYPRARLSEFLAGDVSEADMQHGQDSLAQPSLVERRGCAVLRIDPTTKTVIDAEGRIESYAQLVLATGSSARRIYIPGISLPGVFVFRSLQDAKKLYARRKPGHRVVVLGGGALGLESALAMRSGGAEVAVVDHNIRLMCRQLDKQASAILKAEMAGQGITFYFSHGIKSILGVAQVTGIQLWKGGVLACDTLILATGITANTGLAKMAGLRIAQGILVNDRMESSVPYIYAVGECAQHQGQVYSLLAPGLAQAAVVADVILGKDACYQGSVMATRLKNIETQVFSMGTLEHADGRLLRLNPVYRNTSVGIYRKLILEQGCLKGLIMLGACPELSALQEAIKHRRRITIFQLLRFLCTGEVFGHEVSGVAAWPEAAVVCQCLGITRGMLSRSIQDGCVSLERLACESGASRMCGSCKPLLAEMLSPGLAVQALPIRKPLMGISIAATVLAFAVFFMPPIPVSETVQGRWKLDMLWLDTFWKQVTGYHLLGFSVLSMLLSARKRLKFFKLGSFNGWRRVHTVLGLLMLAILILHTGFSLGSNLNFALMTSFLSATILGTFAGSIAALEGKLGVGFGGVARRWGNKLHIWMSWPLPVLLIFHIVSVYFF